MNNLETLKSTAVLELRKSLDELIKYHNKIDNVLKSIETLKDGNVILTKKEKKKFKIKKLYKFLYKKNELYNRHIKVTNTSIRLEQEKCDHKYSDGTNALEYEGHDSHHDYYVCKICGHSVSV